VNFELNDRLLEIKTKIDNIKKCIKIDEVLRPKFLELEKKANDVTLWDDQDEAKFVLKERTRLLDEINDFDDITKKFQDLQDLKVIISDSHDEDLIKLAEEDLAILQKLIESSELKLLFSGEFDYGDAFLTINSGAGGTESNDWTEMLFRMYCRWCERKKFKVELIDKLNGDDAGIKSVTLKIIGQRAYGWLKNESGVHRLVRISPFDSDNKRHTSFSSVLVYPVIDKNVNIEIDQKDLKIDTYRSSGAGGQHVNKTDSAIRITHLPTGIIVQSQNDRSQHKNKDEAMSRLKSILYQRELENKEKHATSGQDKTLIEWGYQIRSYVLHPYQMVNDLRTEHKIGNAAAVLDGDLDEFIVKKLMKDAMDTEGDKN
jgi:peptide chain release factor 2